jgi:hypothetical protein
VGVKKDPKEKEKNDKALTNVTFDDNGKVMK